MNTLFSILLLFLAIGVIVFLVRSELKVVQNIKPINYTPPELVDFNIKKYYTKKELNNTTGTYVFNTTTNSYKKLNSDQLRVFKLLINNKLKKK